MDIQCRFVSNSCIVCNLNTTQRCEIKSFIGKHGEGRSNNDINMLDISGATLHYLPSGLAKFFPQLTELSVYASKLKSITSNDLQGLEKLETFKLHNNEIRSLPDDLFKHSRKLKHFVVSEDHLTSMSSRLFDPIPDDQLEIVGLASKLIDVLYRKDGKKMCGFGNPAETVEELKKLINSSCTPHIQFPFKANTDYVKRLWDEKIYSDFTIIVGSKKIQVHRSILAVQSSVFASKFKDKNEEKPNELEIFGQTEEVVEKFLRLFYTGVVENDENALEMFILSCVSDTPEWKSIYEAIVIENLSDEKNILRALKVGSIHKSDRMINAAYSKLKDLYPKELWSDSLKQNPQQVKAIINATKEHQKKIRLIDRNRQKMVQNHKENIKKMSES